MASSTHTPGPWRADPAPTGDYRIVYSEPGNWLAKVYADGESEVAKADARLIAAAPDLLHALEMVRDANRSDPHIPDYALRTIDAAIAKATEGTA